MRIGQCGKTSCKLWGVLIFCSLAFRPVSAEPTLFGIDPLSFSTSAGAWGAFGLPDAIEARDGGLLLDIQPSDETDWPDTVTGGINLPIGDVELEFEDYQLEIDLRLLSNNEAPLFVVTLGENGAPQTGENYQYQILLDELEEDEWTTIERPLIDASRIATQGGDGEPFDGFTNLQIHTPFQSTDALNVEIGRVVVRPTPSAAPDPTIYRFDGNIFTGGYTFGSYSGGEAVTNNRDTVVIDAPPGGGLGIRTTEESFDPTTHDLVIRGRLAEDNEAEFFHVNLKDNDGAQARDFIAAEEWMYTIQTSEFSRDEFTEVRVPVSNFTFRWSGNGNAEDGNSTPDFGLYQLQLHSLRNVAGQLRLELESIEIVDRGAPLELGDFNGDGGLGLADVERLIAAALFGPAPEWFDINDDNRVDTADAEYWLRELKNTYIGDSDMDGQFSSSDFVTVFIAGKYETEEAATWGQGDWNMDGVFGSSDFVSAFIDGGYEQGPRATIAVPEPGRNASFVLSLLFVGSIAYTRTARRRPTLQRS